LSRVIRPMPSGNGHSSTPYVLYDIEANARSVLESAREEARAIIEGAKSEADGLLDALRSDAEGEARKRGYEAGFVEGKKALFENHTAEFRKDVDSVLSLLYSMKSSLEDGKRRLAEAAERDLVVLALAVAKKIVEREVSLSPEVATNVVRRAVGLLGERETVELLVNPEDAKLIEAYLPDLKREFADLDEVQVTPEASVARGGCVARTEAGSVDARIECQIEQIAKELLENVR